ncbi:transcription termination/antitermination protein NusG [Candidatus Laterigemmans baculatus]|uniref:transcription termination/antitermination protein NusG n=1 Tax=Candidatus Laterigemmans baculatus TaxID=2770505 RepID=UPI001F41A403|nr:transcription termination/antitermination protein NusG [Candidatus Laterigemmans baculatus]
MTDAEEQNPMTDDESSSAAGADESPETEPQGMEPQGEQAEAGDDAALAKTTKGSSKAAKPRTDEAEPEPQMDWYILKVAFNREESIRDALEKRVRMEGMEEYFGDIVVPTEDLVEFTRAGKRRIVKRKLLPGYLMVHMVINDDTWFLVRETGGISDFTGSAGKPQPMDPADVARFIQKPELGEDEEVQLKTSIPFRVGDRVRVKEGNFQNQEGEIDAVDEANGRITVIINIFGRSVPMELDHWQVEEL